MNSFCCGVDKGYFLLKKSFIVCSQHFFLLVAEKADTSCKSAELSQRKLWRQPTEKAAFELFPSIFLVRGVDRSYFTHNESSPMGGENDSSRLFPHQSFSPLS